MDRQTLQLDGNSLSLEQIEDFVYHNTKIEIAASAREKVQSARDLVEEWVAKDEPVYGVTTGFGEFANVKISHEDIRTLQKNLIMSHAVGCGESLPPFIVKIMMLLRINALLKGYSGIQFSTLELMAKLLNEDVIPLVPSQGSVGSSGDLVQLAHLVLALIGKGKVQYVKNIWDASLNKTVSSTAALKKLGLKKIELEAKEGLALINGTQMMTSFAAFIAVRANKLKKVADIAASLSHEALRATDKAFHPKLHELRPYKGQRDTAKNVLAMIKASKIRRSHIEDDPRIQDAYSIRCVPQVHGASRDAIDYITSRVAIEINSANDNPLIFPELGMHIEGGNFHGQPMALAMDFMAIALSEYANVSERRTERMVNGALSGLPRFLAFEGGLNSGLMIAQYTAASLVSENKVLSHPASVDSIPTSANQEDHNSMGSIAAQKCYRILGNLEHVLAVELMTAAQAVEFLKPLKCGKGTLAAYEKIRTVIEPLLKDRPLHEDLSKVTALVRNDELLNAVEKVVKLR